MLIFKAHKVIEIIHDDKNKFQGAICLVRFPWKIQEFNICFSLTPQKMNFVIQSNGFKWTSSYKITNSYGLCDNINNANGLQVTN
jgi:hypothetical protein